MSTLHGLGAPKNTRAHFAPGPMLIGLFLASSAQARTPSHPPAFEARYTVTYHGFHAGKMVQQFAVDSNGHYQIAIQTSGTITLFGAKASEKSSGIWGPRGPQPNTHTYQYRMLGQRGAWNTQFDLKNHTQAFQRDGKTTTFPLPPRVHDRLSYQLALRYDWMRNRPNITYWVSHKGSVQPYTFRLLRRERLKTRLGWLDTLCLERRRDPSSAIQLWLAPTYDYLAVKVIEVQKGKITAEATIDRYRLTPL